MKIMLGLNGSHAYTCTGRFPGTLQVLYVIRLRGNSEKIIRINLYVSSLNLLSYKFDMQYVIFNNVSTKPLGQGFDYSGSIRWCSLTVQWPICCQ